MPKSVYKSLLNDPNVKRWFNNNRKGSPIVADIYLRRLGSFCKANKTSPAAYAQLSLVKMENVAIDYVDFLASTKSEKTKRPYAPSYIDSCIKAVRSWAIWNRKEFKRKIKIADKNSRPSLEDERIPTQDELRKVLYADTTPLRTRVSISLISFAGTRPEVQGDYEGLDGLRIKDFPDIEIKEKEVIFAKIPTLLVVRQQISKSGHQYLTFLGEEGCEILKSYLERRLSEGESLTPSSEIIATSRSQAKRSMNFKMTDASPFLASAKISHGIREAMRTVGLPWRPYVFRSYFDMNLMLAESRGIVSHAYQQFWMGHSGDMEAQYTTNKNRLPEMVIEDMRSAYKKVAETFLQTSTARRSTVTQDDIKASARREMLEAEGYTKEDLDALGDLSQLSTQQFKELYDGKKRASLGLKGNGNQKVVPFLEVKRYIEEGWRYERDFPPSEAIISLPGR